MNRPEILAPAGSFESLAAAVYCGADAVYLGSKRLNARRNAGNFDDDGLARAVEFCHTHGVRVYQTLNVLMFDAETQEAIDAIHTAADLGVDALLVQDLGVAALARRCAPDLPLYASTQMAVHTLSGALEAQRLGCQRIVLARELSAAEIAHIRAHCSAELEVFVHGALCMCVSGQCYLSSMLGGRSGNRGLCAQPCRLPFTAAGRPFALSLKDLTLVDRVAELAALGVHSLKIEGRMKRPEYVAAAVTAVHRALEGLSPDLDQLRSVFSRSGFTSGYFDGTPDRSMFGIRDRDDVVAADSVLQSLTPLATREVPRIGLEGAFCAQADQPITLSLRDPQGNTVTQSGDPPQAARTRPTDAAHVRQSLEKTGGTPFFFSALDVTLGDGLMLPVSQLNALRRDSLEQLTALRARPRPIPFADTAPRYAANVPDTRVPALRAHCTLSQLSADLLETCADVILPLTDIDAAIGKGVAPSRILAALPRILFSGEEAVSEKLADLKARGVSRAWVGNLGSIRTAREAGFALSGGWSLNLTNAHAVRCAKELGLTETELSFELTLPRAAAINGGIARGLVGYGALPLMVFRNCPIKASVGCANCRQTGELIDRKGIRFPIRCRDGVSELLNSVPLYLADRRDELRGFDFVTLWFTDESPARCAAVAAAMAHGSAETPASGYTRGLYYRTVL